MGRRARPSSPRLWTQPTSTPTAWKGPFTDQRGPTASTETINNPSRTARAATNGNHRLSKIIIIIIITPFSADPHITITICKAN